MRPSLLQVTVGDGGFVRGGWGKDDACWSMERFNSQHVNSKYLLAFSNRGSFSNFFFLSKGINSENILEYLPCVRPGATQLL